MRSSGGDDVSGEIVALQKRIQSQSAEVGILGLEDVGLTEAMEFARAEFRVTGFFVFFPGAN